MTRSANVRHGTSVRCNDEECDVCALVRATDQGAPSPFAPFAEETFEKAWARKEAEGYRYGRDALENVRFGWELRGESRGKRHQCIIGEPCAEHSFIHGAEAEELRSEIEALLIDLKPGARRKVQAVLDRVDARDSVAWLEFKREQGEKA